jgi:hypothetical protein
MPKNSRSKAIQRPVDASPSRDHSEGPWSARARSEERYRGTPEHGEWYYQRANPTPTTGGWTPSESTAAPTPVAPKVTPLRPNWALLEVPVHPSPEILRLADEGPEGKAR